MQELSISEAEVTSAISHHDRSQMMTELLPIFQVLCWLPCLCSSACHDLFVAVVQTLRRLAAQ